MKVLFSDQPVENRGVLSIVWTMASALLEDGSDEESKITKSVVKTGLYHKSIVNWLR